MLIKQKEKGLIIQKKVVDQMMPLTQKKVNDKKPIQMKRKNITKKLNFIIRFMMNGKTLEQRLADEQQQDKFSWRKK